MKGSATPDGLFRGSGLFRVSAKDLLAFTNKSSDAGWRAWEWWWVYERLLLSGSLSYLELVSRPHRKEFKAWNKMLKQVQHDTKENVFIEKKENAFRLLKPSKTYFIA